MEGKGRLESGVWVGLGRFQTQPEGVELCPLEQKIFNPFLPLLVFLQQQFPLSFLNKLIC